MTASTLLLASAAAQGTQAAWTPESEYAKTLFVTPNGDPVLTGPMLYTMIGGGDATYEHATDPESFGGGQYTKVGLAIQVYYASETEGPDLVAPFEQEQHMRYYINRGTSANSLPLPPDVGSVADLPDIVRFGLDPTGTDDDLASWASTAQFPRTVAGLEWARYLNLPISVQLQVTISHGGQIGTQIPDLSPPVYYPKNHPDTTDLDAFTESQGKFQCMWDVADICDPNDDDPATMEKSGASWGTFSFATPTLADSDIAVSMGHPALPYRELVLRNLDDAISQLLAVASHPRYAGRLVAIAIDPEIHLPAHRDDSYELPKTPGVTEDRAFFEDYHPAMIREFAYYLRDRYDDNLAAFLNDFEQDYLDSGGFGHSHDTLPATWEEIDAPRNYPTSTAPALSAYWQEWCNFQTQVIDRFLEELVATAADAGIPPTRLFTHQPKANGSYNANRVTGNGDLWLDDWSHIETSRGYAGISQYTPFGVTGISGGTQLALYDNLERRDEAWGAPEYNPWVKQPIAYAPVVATLAEIQLVLGQAWDKRAQVLWMHAWGSPSHPAVDVYTHYWIRDPQSLVLEDPDSQEDWTAVNLVPYPAGNPTALQASSGATTWYLEWTGTAGQPFSYEAEDFPCLGVESIAFPTVANPEGKSFDMRVEFRKDGEWYAVTQPGWMRYGTAATQWWGIDLRRGDPMHYTGTITGLRIHPLGYAGSWGNVLELALFGYDDYTTAMQELLVSKRDTPRPALAPQPISAPLGTRFDLGIVNAYGSGGANARLVVYGNDPDASNTNYVDFGYQNNFYPATVTCGAVARQAIVAPASRLMGQRKTGRYRQVILPNNPNLALRFGIGIVNGNMSDDGVRFRILIRDHSTRELVEAFSEEYRLNQWALREADLSPWAGKTVDLLFETHAISNDVGDESAWAVPTLVEAAGGGG